MGLLKGAVVLFNPTVMAASQDGDLWISDKAVEVREKIRLCARNCAGMVNCYREVC